MLVVTFFWGITFTIVKDAIAQIDLFAFLGQRFTLSALLLFGICLPRRRPFSLDILWKGAILGLLLFGGYAFQTIGLLYTTASNTAFVTGLNVILVPVFGCLFFGRSLSLTLSISVVCAGVGLFLLCTGGTITVNPGDLIVILCAISLALHIIYTGRFVQGCDAYWLTTIQLTMVALCSNLCAWTREETIFFWEPDILWAMIICVIFATVFAFLVQTSMQRYIAPVKTALIFCMEPVFGALYAHMYANERLGEWGWLGALSIFAAMILAEWPGRQESGKQGYTRDADRESNNEQTVSQ